MVHPELNPANKLQPFATPRLLNIGPEKTIHTAAKALRAKSFAAKSEAAY
jgi:hypothetical protein